MEEQLMINYYLNLLNLIFKISNKNKIHKVVFKLKKYKHQK